MPITAFIGVRISWLMVARNALLASLAARRRRGFLRLLEHRAFWIAITAWLAKVSGSAHSLSVNARMSKRATLMAPRPRPCHIIGACASA